MPLKKAGLEAVKGCAGVDGGVQSHPTTAVDLFVVRVSQGLSVSVVHRAGFPVKGRTQAFAFSYGGSVFLVVKQPE